MDLIKALPSARPPFLLLSPLCVALGLALSYQTSGAINMWLAFLTLLGAITAAVAVNTINEYQDFTSGLDLTTDKTPFSGGSGLLVEQPDLKHSVKLLAIASTAITIVIGCFLLWFSSWLLFPVGLVGMIIIMTYTRWLNKAPILCYLAPGVGFAILMVMGTVLVQNQAIVLTQMLIASIPAIAISNLLLVNQFPDKEADAAIGRNHVLIFYGYEKASLLYLFTSLFNCLLLAWLIYSEVLSYWSLLVFIPLLLPFIVFRGLALYAKQLAKYPQYMALNVIATLVSTLLLTLSLIAS
ncbi:prenyltransferase [Thalassotalea marina]|uniref:1,4-dihydroxy-2-naphthoate octaprenyltransferase n=1 Tax=Thalassotalea marina TaxID=1673741 RepID=A0A919BNS6_9GAMM|nr:prenyltransferase [Thalassotalea marina]GHG02981.1 hypothetical protein GCM10017161_35020 [Thalassotalea marina]